CAFPLSLPPHEVRVGHWPHSSLSLGNCSTLPSPAGVSPIFDLVGVPPCLFPHYPECVSGISLLQVVLLSNCLIQFCIGLGAPNDVPDTTGVLHIPIWYATPPHHR